MKFAYPEFLFALFAVAIPIIIHLFNIRKFKKVYFSNVGFLREIKRENQSKSKLKQLLILASRILAIIFLVLAFAQPFIPTSNSTTNLSNVVGVYIDNSFSMEGNGEQGSLLTDAKSKAIEAIKSYNKTDKFVIIDNQFSAGSQRLLTAEEAIIKIESIDITTETRLLSDVFLKLKEAIGNETQTNHSILVFSDFQKNTANINNIKPDTSIQHFFFLVQTEQVSNLYIDSCWFENPTHLYLQNEQLIVRIKNNSDQDLENIPLKLFINDNLITPAIFSVKANNQTEIQLHFKNHQKGIQNGKIELTDSPVTKDDIFYFSYSITEQINVVEINEKDTFPQLRAVFSTDSLFNFSKSSVEQLDYSNINKNQLIVISHLKQISSGLTATIKTFIENGGSILVIPAKELDFESYRAFTSALSINSFVGIDTTATKVNYINYKHPLYINVFEGKPASDINLPMILSHYTSTNTSTTYKNNILSLKNNEPLLTEYKINKGTIYLLHASLDESFGNFSKHAIFVPTLYNIALLSQPTYPLFYTIGNNDELILKTNETEGSLKIKKDNLELIPQTKKEMGNTKVFITQGITESGLYQLQSPFTNMGVAYNYNRLESDLTTYDKTELEDLLVKNNLSTNIIDTKNQTISHSINEIQNGKRYWKICIILALVFLITEIALIKLLK